MTKRIYWSTDIRIIHTLIQYLLYCRESRVENTKGCCLFCTLQGQHCQQLLKLFWKVLMERIYQKTSFGAEKIKETRHVNWWLPQISFFSEWLNQWRSLCMRPLLDGDSSRIWWTPDDALCVEKRALALVGWVGLRVTGEGSCSSANPLETCKSFCASKAGEELLRDQRNKQKTNKQNSEKPIRMCIWTHSSLWISLKKKFLFWKRSSVMRI